ncbi:MAG TPA: hypothetical protein VFX17_03580 [Patescibacteria group bacterium]|nr:hypothetical protein [Patescibacteria group bacterium]
MHKQTLREVAKFLAGLIAGDFLALLWLYMSGSLPFDFMGVQFDQRAAAWGMVFDLVIMSLFIHYAWYYKDKPRNTSRQFHALIGIIFAIVAILHLSRLIFGWQLEVGSWMAPYWLNAVGAVVAATLSYISFHLGRK